MARAASKVKKVVGAPEEALRILSEAVPGAAARLVELIGSENERTAQSAAESVLDRVCGKASSGGLPVERPEELEIALLVKKALLARSAG